MKNPLNPLRFNLSPEKLRQNKCLLFDFWIIKFSNFLKIQKCFQFGPIFIKVNCLSIFRPKYYMKSWWTVISLNYFEDGAKLKKKFNNKCCNIKNVKNNWQVKAIAHFFACFITRFCCVRYRCHKDQFNRINNNAVISNTIFKLCFL